MQNPDMIYGYARVSTVAQDETGQVHQLKAAGCEKVFREKITGTTADRPQFAKLMKARFLKNEIRPVFAERPPLW